MILKILKIWKAKPHVKVACLKIKTFQFCIENHRFEAKKRPFFFFETKYRRGRIWLQQFGSNWLKSVYIQWYRVQKYMIKTQCVYIATQDFMCTQRKNAYINAKKKCVYTQTQRKNAWISTHKEKMRVLICTLKKNIYIYMFFFIFSKFFFIQVFFLFSV